MKRSAVFLFMAHDVSNGTYKTACML